MISEPLLAIEDVADRLNLSISTIRYAVRAKRIGHVRVGRVLRFSQADIDAFVPSDRIVSGRDVHVYVIGIVGRTRPVKVGYAADVRSRLIKLQVGNHEELELRASLPCCDLATAERAERAVHKMFGRQRIRGEWFDADTVSVQAVLSAMAGVHAG